MTVSPPAYFDWNATAPLRVDARAAMIVALDRCGNPSSVHGAGRAARSVVEAARSAILTSIGAPVATLTFTSGGTEANFLALRGLVQAAAGRAERVTRLIVSAIEHDSILQTARRMADEVAGLRVTEVAVMRSGILDLAAWRQALFEGKGRAICALMFANNETGVIQPVQEASEIARAHGAAIVCDAAQGWGRIPMDFPALGADILTLSAHKAGGPKGTGAVIAKEGVHLAPQIVGGGQELGLRAGTHNVAAIAGFGAAAQTEFTSWAGLAAKREALEAALIQVAPDAVIYGHSMRRLPNTICIGLPGVAAETQVMSLDMDGVAVSAGAACSSGKVKASHVLRAMGVSAEAASQAVRISFGPTTREEDFARLIASWTKLVGRTSPQSGRPAA